MRKILGAFFITLSGIFMAINLTFCATPENKWDNIPAEFMAFNPKYPEEKLFVIWCWQPRPTINTSTLHIDEAIEKSEFCIIGKRIVYKYQFERGFEDKGEIEVQSIIYGNPETQRMPYSYTGPNIDPLIVQVPEYARLSVPIDGPDNSTIIVMGKGKGASIEFLKVIPLDWTIISPQAINLIKELQDLDPAEFQKVKNKLLVESSNSELLCYLFRDKLYTTPPIKSELDIPKTMTLIETLYNEGLLTPQRKFLAYGFAICILYDYYDKWAKLTEAQQQRLMDIALTKFSQITTAQEGRKYLGLLNLFIMTNEANRRSYQWRKIYPSYTRDPNVAFGYTNAMGKPDTAPDGSILLEKNPIFKDNIKQITDSLSERFKDDPDYPEWQKWVNKIFPAESPNQK